MSTHRAGLHRSFLLVFLLAQLGGFHGESMSGTRRAVEILAGQKSTNLIPPLPMIVAAEGGGVEAAD
ncbi:hypothetical protein [Jiella sonneratiae]|uniref:Secreted protein n=1 Tax=Jiella sonneratiae TaxID=2816856 RepID=A0ABS3J0P8_9HYPH|nr:hypothetical protein [Jiella sonneratiae]MBO0902156.1 hypothetical protein [Jiella sonneratiae]